MRNQQFLFSVIILLVVVVGILAYNQRHDDMTLGQKVGNTIDRATGDMKNP